MAAEWFNLMPYGFNYDKSRFYLQRFFANAAEAFDLDPGTGTYTVDLSDVWDTLSSSPAFKVGLFESGATDPALVFYNGDENTVKNLECGDVTGTAVLTPEGTIVITYDNSGADLQGFFVDAEAYPYEGLRGVLHEGQAGGGEEFDRKYLGKNWIIDTDDRYLVVIGGGEDGSQFDVWEITHDGYITRKSSTAVTRQSANPTANHYISGEIILDANNERVGYSEIMKTTSGSIYRSFAVDNEKANGEQVTAAIYLHANKDGTTSMSLSSGTKLDKQYIAGLGSLAAKNSVTVPAHALSGNNKQVTSSSATVAAGAHKQFTFNLSTPSGWSFASLMKISLSAPKYFAITGFDVDGNSVQVGVNNITSASHSTTCTIQVRYMQIPQMTAS